MGLNYYYEWHRMDYILWDENKLELISDELFDNKTDYKFQVQNDIILNDKAMLKGMLLYERYHSSRRYITNSL